MLDIYVHMGRISVAACSKMAEANIHPKCRYSQIIEKQVLPTGGHLILLTSL